jgi:tetratricopeptide (TPR) repeat protein
MKRRLLRGLAVLLLVTIIGLAAGRVGLEVYTNSQIAAADRALERQNYQEGWEHLRRALLVRRNDPALRLRAARVCRQSGDFAEAEEQLKRCRALYGSPSDDYQMERLLLNAQTGRLDDVYEKLIAFLDDGAPESPLILEALCQALIQLDIPQAALGFANRWLDLEPDNVQGLYCKAVCVMQVGGAELAVAPLVRALRRDPSRDDIRETLASVLIDTQRFDDAIRECEQVLAHDPENVTVRIDLARAHAGKGEADEARAALDVVLAREPNNPHALLERGRLALAVAEYDEALVWLRKAVAAEPYSVAAATQLLNCLKHIGGREQEARELAAKNERLRNDLQRLDLILRDVLPHKPATPDLCCELGRLFLQTGREDAGTQWLYKALRQDPNCVPAHELLADYWQRNGDRERAEAHRRFLRDKAGTVPRNGQAVPQP